MNVKEIIMMKKRVWIVFVLIVILITTCKKKNNNYGDEDISMDGDVNNNIGADIAAVVTIGKSEAFELGYIVPCYVVDTLKGDIDPLLIENDSGEKILSIIFPPVDIDDLYENLSGSDSPEYTILNLTYGGKSIDDLKTFSPSPGSGMGEFLPPLLVGADDSCWLISKMYGINEDQLEDIRSGGSLK